MTGRVDPVRLVVVATHPVQYLSPWLRDLAARDALDLEVWYVTLPDAIQQGVGFGRPFNWDIPLLEGYSWRELGNEASRPGLDGFFGSRVSNVTRRLKEAAPDAVLVTGWQQWSLLQIALGCRRLGIPLLVRGESNDLSVRPHWKRFLQGRLLRLYDRFLSIGYENRAFYRRRGVEDHRLFSCPYFVDNNRFEPAQRGAGDLRRAWGVSVTDTVFLFVGKLQPKKHPDRLLSAFLELRHLHSDIHLVFVGDGEMRDALERQARVLKSAVTFSGFVNQGDIARYYDAADCLVLPSDAGETWGLVVNEAMASGIPAIVSDRVGCHPDLVVEGETGFCYAFPSRAGLVDRMNRIRSNPTERRRMGESARTRVRAYSPRNASKGLLMALDSLPRVRRAGN